MIGWEKDKIWSDRFLPEIKGIVGRTLISEPPIEDDQQRNTDLIVLKLDAVRVACRIRKNEYLSRYGNEFTIRAGRPSGIKTELTKVIEGWGDYFFYGFSDTYEKSLAKWFMGDLKKFRIWYMRQLKKNHGVPPGKKLQNRDGSSFFFAFNADLIPDFCVAYSEGNLR